MRISQNGLELIKAFEGFRASAYPDPATGNEPWTIGYGSTYVDGVKVKKGDKITEQNASAQLEKVANSFLDSISDLIEVELNQNQIDALASFVYNIGVGNFKTSSTLKFINQSDFYSAAQWMLKWNKANGKVMTGLAKRRTLESTLFLKPI